MGSKQGAARLLGIQVDPYGYALEWKREHGVKVIAHLFPDVPEEIIHASGALPFAVMETDLKISLAHVHLPSFTCSLLKGPLETALQNNLDFIDGMVIPYVCDSTRAFSQVWEANFPGLFNHTLWFPKKLEGKAVKRFLSLEFLRMKEELEVFVGRQITDSDLRKSIQVYNRNRNLLRELSRLSTWGQVSLTHADNLAIVKASMMMPIEESSVVLTKLLEEIRLHSGPQDMKDSVRISLFGLFCESHSIFNSLDQLGIHVVDDNLYNGTRYFLQDVDEEVDPVKGLVDRHLAKDPLSCFHYPRDQWRRYLIEKITDNKIEGLVYLTPRYCDAMAFDYPAVKELLQELDIPVLLLEMDSSSISKGQLRTRLEAFAEVLRERKNDSL